MPLSTAEQERLKVLLHGSGGDAMKAMTSAYEEGLLAGALRVTQSLGAKLGLQNPPVVPPQGNGDDDEQDSPITASDRAQLSNLGIDPHKKFRVRNTTFTITGWKPSRWKYPVSAVTQNGRRYKFTIDQVKRHQGA